MSSQFIRRLSPLYVLLFTFLLSSQLGKHFFFPFSYLSGIRIDYLAPTVYLTDILSLPFIIYFLLHCVIPVKTGIQTLITLFKKVDFRLDPLLRGDDNRIYWGYFYFVFIFLVIVNYILALSQPLWFYNAFKIIQWAAVFYYFRSQAKNKALFSAALLGLLLGGLAQLTLALTQLTGRASVQGLWYYLGERSFSIFTPSIAKAYFIGREFLRPYGTFSHPNSLAGFYLLLYTFILTQKRVSNTFFKTMALTVFSFLVLISFSRTAIAVYVIINLLYFLQNILTCRICLYAKLATAALLIFFAFNITGDLNSFQKRNDFTQKSIAIIASKPFSGVGVGSYLIAQHQYPQKFATFFEQPVHNIFLLTIAQLGIPLSLLLATMIIRLASPKLFKRNSEGGIIFLPLLVIVLTGCMDHYWLTLQQNVLVTAVLFGVLCVYETKTSRT